MCSLPQCLSYLEPSSVFIIPLVVLPLQSHTQIGQETHLHDMKFLWLSCCWGLLLILLLPHPSRWLPCKTHLILQWERKQKSVSRKSRSAGLGKRLFSTVEATHWVLCPVLGPSLQKGHWGLELVLRREMKLVKGLESFSYKEQLRELLSCLAWRRASLAKTSLLPPALKGGCSEVGIGLFCHVSSEWTRRNGLKLHQRRYSLDLRIFLNERVLRNWKKLLRGVMDWPSVEMFKRHLHVALRNMV